MGLFMLCAGDRMLSGFVSLKMGLADATIVVQRSTAYHLKHQPMHSEIPWNYLGGKQPLIFKKHSIKHT